MNAKRITLAIAILSTLGTGSAALTGALPPSWALVVGSLGAGAYALARALTKIRAGAPVKKLLGTTEAWGAGLAILAAIVSAVAGVVPPSVAAGAAAAAGVLVQISRSLQAAKVPAVQGEDEAVTKPEKPSAKHS
jgi:hypothetical protein